LIALTDVEVGAGAGFDVAKNGPGTSRLCRLMVGACEDDAATAVECGGGVHGAFLLLNSSELSAKIHWVKSLFFGNLRFYNFK
jgi:hypothetical protein